MHIPSQVRVRADGKRRRKLVPLRAGLHSRQELTPLHVPHVRGAEGEGGPLSRDQPQIRCIPRPHSRVSGNERKRIPRKIDLALGKFVFMRQVSFSFPLFQSSAILNLTLILIHDFLLFLFMTQVYE